MHVNHLPYMPFPPNWPTYIPKDKLAAWFEAYVESMELNYWTGTEFEGGSYDDKERALVGDAAPRRRHRTRECIRATSSWRPASAAFRTFRIFRRLRNFGGTILHSSQYDDGEAWKGKNALVIGTGNSGHDIAQDLYSSGAKVTLVQRSSTLIVNVEPSAQLAYALYDEGLPLEDCDLITDVDAASAGAEEPHPAHRAGEEARTRTLLDGLERKGFKLDFGEDGTGWQFKYLTRGGGYYFNVGCSDLIVEGEIGLVQFSDIAEFVADGARMRDGETLPADLIVLATGYKGQEHLVRKLFGDDVADRVGPIWGFGDEPGVAQHVHAHGAAGPLVHRRQLRPVPHLLEVPRLCRSRPARSACSPEVTPVRTPPARLGRTEIHRTGKRGGKRWATCHPRRFASSSCRATASGRRSPPATLDVLREAERCSRSVCRSTRCRSASRR